MSWDDRSYSDDPGDRIGRPGGDWRGVRPTFDNPMSWALTVGRFLGITIRVHIVFLIYIVVQLARALASPDEGDDAPLGFGLAAWSLACLFGIVLIHEYGHCLACRKHQGEADEILMWPLGGLAFCRPPQHWLAHLATAVGGPLVNVVICLLLGFFFALTTGELWGVALPNPFMLAPFSVLRIDALPLWLMIGLYFIHHISFILLLFNLLPIFPLDGGRIIQASLWPKVGYERSMKLAVYTGYIGAIALGVVGFVMKELMLVAIAFFGGITCWMTLKQLQYTDALMADGGGEYASSLRDDDVDQDEPARPSRAEKRAEKEAEKQAVTEQEIDRILAKIGESGMDSLSRRERALLQRETERKRDAGV
jgi:stage IV sporulation protein FB